MATQARVVRCGRMNYADAWALQRELLSARQRSQIPDVVLLLEHPPVITVGRAGRQANILMPREALAAQGVEVFEIERGGDVTYHGPGQLVGYPILDLRALDEDIGRYVRGLEAGLLQTLAAFGIAAERWAGYPGVWVGGAKIAAIGVAVKRRVTMHGFALNVAPALEHFRLINPCGLGKPVTSMAEVLGRAVRLSDVEPVLEEALRDALGLALTPVALEALREQLSAHGPARDGEPGGGRARETPAAPRR